MDLQEVISNAASKMRQSELADMPVLSLGEIIGILEAIPPRRRKMDALRLLFSYADNSPQLARGIC